MSTVEFVLSSGGISPLDPAQWTVSTDTIVYGGANTYSLTETQYQSLKDAVGEALAKATKEFEEKHGYSIQLDPKGVLALRTEAYYAGVLWALNNIPELAEEFNKLVPPQKQIMWLIWSNEHRAWWRPQACGYTAFRSEAGRYSYDDACKICEQANRHIDHDHPPAELMIPE